MERRKFLGFAFGLAAGAAALAAGAQAAPLSPQTIGDTVPLVRPSTDAIPAVTSGDEAARLKPEQVRWHGGGHHGGWHHGGWHRGHHWGWRHPRRHWHHRHWRRW